MPRIEALAPEISGAGFVATVQSNRARMANRQASIASRLEVGHRFAPRVNEQQLTRLRSLLLDEAKPNGRAEYDLWIQTAAAMGLSERQLVELIVGAPTPDELHAYESDFLRFAATQGEPIPNRRQAADFAWRLAAGHRIEAPTFCLRPLDLRLPVDGRDEMRCLRELRDINAARWDGPLCREATDELLATVRAATDATARVDSAPHLMAGRDRPLFSDYPDDDLGDEMLVFAS